MGHPVSHAPALTIQLLNRDIILPDLSPIFFPSQARPLLQAQSPFLTGLSPHGGSHLMRFTRLFTLRCSTWTETAPRLAAQPAPCKYRYGIESLLLLGCFRSGNVCDVRCQDARQPRDLLEKELLSDIQASRIEMTSILVATPIGRPSIFCRVRRRGYGRRLAAQLLQLPSAIDVAGLPPHKVVWSKVVGRLTSTTPRTTFTNPTPGLSLINVAVGRHLHVSTFGSARWLDLWAASMDSSTDKLTRTLDRVRPRWD
jgi:hypothetical protein